MTRFLTATAIGMVLAGAAIAKPAAPAEPATPPAAAAAAPAVGKVTVRSEVQAKVRDHFARLDANKDGAITTEEATAMRGMAMAKARSGMAGEHLRMGHHGMRDPAAAFDRIDTNKDGSISRDEFAKGREVRIEKRIVMREGGAGAAKPGIRREMRMRHMGGGMGGGHLIVMADTDKDGRITLTEAEAMALQHFDKLDANKDGQVTPEERRAGRPMIMKMKMAPKAG